VYCFGWTATLGGKFFLIMLLLLLSLLFLITLYSLEDLLAFLEWSAHIGQEWEQLSFCLSFFLLASWREANHITEQHTQYVKNREPYIYMRARGQEVLSECFAPSELELVKQLEEAVLKIPTGKAIATV
jgi:hypothetical protein